MKRYLVYTKSAKHRWMFQVNKFWISVTVCSVVNTTHPAVILKRITLLLCYHGTWVPRGSGPSQEVTPHTYYTIQSTVDYSVTLLFPFRSHPLHQSFCVTSSPWIKHTFYLEIAATDSELCLIGWSTLRESTWIYRVHHQIPDTRSYLVETRRLCISLRWFSGINFPWKPGPPICVWASRLPV